MDDHRHRPRRPFAASSTSAIAATGRAFAPLLTPIHATPQAMSSPQQPNQDQPKPEQPAEAPAAANKVRVD